MTVPARGFPGGRTLKTPFHVLVTKGDKKAIVRVNDVGPGVEGHSPNHMLDLSVAAKDYFGTGEGFRIDFAKGDSKPGPVTGSTDNITASFSGSVSRGGSGDSSDISGGGGGSETQPAMSDADQLKFAKSTFNYNEIREIIGTKKSASLAESISKSSRPSSTAAYQQQMESQQKQQSESGSGYSDEKVGKAVPEINADQMASAQKIQVLGIVT